MRMKHRRTSLPRTSAITFWAYHPRTPASFPLCHSDRHSPPYQTPRPSTTTTNTPEQRYPLPTNHRARSRSVFHTEDRCPILPTRFWRGLKLRTTPPRGKSRHQRLYQPSMVETCRRDAKGGHGLPTPKGPRSHSTGTGTHPGGLPR